MSDETSVPYDRAFLINHVEILQAINRSESQPVVGRRAAGEDQASHSNQSLGKTRIGAWHCPRIVANVHHFLAPVTGPKRSEVVAHSFRSRQPAGTELLRGKLPSRPKGAPRDFYCHN